MYPDFHFFFENVFGIDIPILSIFKTFGFFVALGFIVGAYIWSKELKRKAEEGKIQPYEETQIIGAAPKMSEWLASGAVGFLMGFKLVGLIQNYGTVADDPLMYLFSSKGNWIAGIVGGLLLGYLKYTEKKKAQLDVPKKQTVKWYPHQKIMDIVFIAAGAGFVGAKVFNALETWEHFIQDPIASLFSSGGFTYYGGLILATVALYFYSKMRKFSFKHLCDAAAPALLIAYAVGRLGCQFSGDGDWGIYNSAYLTDPDATLVEQVDERAFINLTKSQPQLFTEFEEIGHIPQIYYPAPSWLPTWAVAMNYTNNVNREGIVIQGDDSHYNRALPASVFPTPIYEFFACSLLFLILWGIRRRFETPLKVFGIYLIFNGLERFFVEKIRVNYKYDWGFLQPTQAEIISFGLILLGLFLLLVKRKSSIR